MAFELQARACFANTVSGWAKNERYSPDKVTG